MTGIDVSRSVRFVSLDTHPANNSLVVTYEILVIVNDLHHGHELTRRAKRDQLQISISALDNLNEIDFKKSANKLTLNLRQLSEEIINKCPVLHSFEAGSQALEDIQLHLLYLFNRKQSQLYQSNPDRPGSSASSRLRSATPSAAARLTSARQGSALTRLSAASDGRKNGQSDVYSALCEKELKSGDRENYSNLESSIRLDGFMSQLELHLSELEASLQIDTELAQNQTDNLEAQLEGLYDDAREKQNSMAIIRRHIGDDHKLASMSENRLLVCAMLRSLQDSDTRDAALSESILFCLIRFTQFEDIYIRLFSSSPTDPIDPIRVVVDQLNEHARLLLSTKQESLALFIRHFYSINSLIIIMNNLIRLDSNNTSIKVIKKLIQQHGKRLATIVISLFSLISRHIASIIRQQSANKYERLILVVFELIHLSQCLSIYKEFVYLLRVKSRTLLDALTTILNALQLCRPGSGSVRPASSGQAKQQNNAAATTAEQLLLVRDQMILSEIYELEIELLKLINNLIYDARFKSNLLRKNLLFKCVLRNLVVFLASSRRSNTLTPFDRSSVLMVPFKSLYELSCNNQIKEELYKSKLITKCLFEYLLSSTADLKTILDSRIATTTTTTTSTKSARIQLIPDQSSSVQPIVDDDQIVLNPTQASHYIIAIWVNLNANKSAPFYKTNSADVGAELQEPLADYIELSTQNLITFVSMLKSNGSEGGSVKGVSRNLEEAQLMLYTHAKLLRNFTQFLSFTQEHEQSKKSRVWLDCYARWVERIASLIDSLLVQSRDSQHLKKGFVVPIMVESVAILANLMNKSSAFWSQGDGGGHHQAPLIPVLDWPKELESILRKLFQVTLVIGVNMDGEHDDLLLVSINLLGTLARHREICHELKSITSSIIEICNFILETKGTDSEMIISCLYTLSQLVNHSVFLQAVCLSLDEANRSTSQGNESTAAHLLVDKLANLIMHGDLSASKLANLILNNMKQFEEQQSLSDSVTCKRRFMCYNGKWLNAIRTNHDDPTTGDGSGLDVSETDTGRVGPKGTLGVLDSIARGKNRLDDYGDDDYTDKGLDLIDNFNHLRTINDDLGSGNRPSNLLGGKDYDTNDGQRQNNEIGRAEGDERIECDDDDDDNDNDEEDDDYDEEENFSEPDLNVIDPNSMIKHLTNRREFRSEILMRK